MIMKTKFLIKSEKFYKGEQICSYHLEIQMKGGKFFENLGFELPLLKVKICFVLFLFLFKFSLQNCISLFLTHVLISCFTNQISIKANIFNVFYFIKKTRYKIKDTQFCVKNLTMHEKRTNNFWPSIVMIRTLGFSVIFLPTIWIFTKAEGDEIKSRRGS